MGFMGELVGFGEAEEFFAPAPHDLIDGLIAQYRQSRQHIDQVADIIAGELGGAVAYFLDGNGRDSRYGTPSVERLFRREGAIRALDSAYWSKAMQLTDVLNYMPQARRTDWNKLISEQTCPEFEEQTVRATLQGLLSQRSQFLAERVAGIFHGLSGEHVTNSPAAFGKRMIVAGVLRAFGHEDHSTCGLINDLRCVIAKFMGRDEPGYSASSGLIRSLKGRWGEWCPVDGGALKIRLYRKGTAHIEVHGDMAWRLNMVLAHIYPTAIPPEFRQKPKRRPKDVQLIMRPLPFAVIELLAAMQPAYRFIPQPNNFRQEYRREAVPNAIEFDRGCQFEKAGKHVVAEAEAVLESIGGTKAEKGWFQFDYNPREVLNEIVASGCIPDQKAHQFYATQPPMAQRAVELAGIGPSDECAEPSAGTGGIADFMPKDRTTCVEISPLRCDVLRAKGHRVEQADFLEWSTQALAACRCFDRIVANPPFADGRALAHLQAAASLIRPGGRMVFILPASMRHSNCGLSPRWTCEWSKAYENAFPGTSAIVAILTATLSS